MPADHWSHEETDDPLYADRRNFYKVEKWSRDGRWIEELLLAGNSLDKARRVFGRFTTRRPRSRLRDYQEFRARGRFSSLADEPFAEHDGELGLGLEPFARRPFPFVSRVVQNQV